MNSRSARKHLFELLWIAIIVTWASLSTQVLFGAYQASTGPQGPPAQAPAATTASHPVEGETFATAQQAADALIAAAGTFDEAALAKIFGPNGKKVIFTGEAAQDRQRALGFAAEAKEKTNSLCRSKNWHPSLHHRRRRELALSGTHSQDQRQMVFRRQGWRAGTPLPPHRFQ